MTKTIEAMGPSPFGEQTGQTMYVGTEEVWSDEPATWLAEFDQSYADGKSTARFQLIHVIRPNHIAEFTLYLGPSWIFTSNSFQIYGGSAKMGSDETVDSLRDWADEIRDRGGFFVAKEATIEQDTWHKHVEERSRRQRHQSTFGPSVRIER